MSIARFIPKPDPANIAAKDLVERLSRLHGQPWELSETGQITAINEEWWAGLYHAENNILHDAAEDGFYVWDELLGIYVPESCHKILIEISRRLLTAAQEDIFMDLKKFRKLRRLETIAKLLKGVADVREPFANHGKALLALDNGVVELKDGQIQFHAFSPRFMLRHKATVPFDAAAKAPRFLEGLVGPMFDADDAAICHQYFGLSLLGVNPLQRMLILAGASESGKSTLINILIAVVGVNRAVQLRTEHLDKQFELDSLRDRTLLVGIDVGQKFLNTPGAQTLKGLTSSDIFHVERKNRPGRKPLQGPFNVIIGTNCDLTYFAQGDAAAWRRRLLILDCLPPSPGRKRIVDFDRVLLATEGSGIVNVWLEGLATALAAVRSTGTIPITETQQNRIDALILRSDAVGVFIRQRIVRDDDAQVSAEDFMTAFQAFCQSNGWVAESETVIQRKANDLMFSHYGKTKSNSLPGKGGKACRGWRNVRLIDDGFRSASED